MRSRAGGGANLFPQVDKEGGVGMEDAAGFFANVFGGERFKDYVSAKLPAPLPPSLP